MIFRTNHASASQLEGLLRLSELDFVPKLSSQVDIADYANKLHLCATRAEAWRDQRLAGFVAFYSNRRSLEGFISSVCIHPTDRGNGIAKFLLAETERIMTLDGVNLAALEVGVSNHLATKLYENVGYRRTTMGGELIRMEKVLGSGLETMQHE